jgi:thiol-disulfide isomerase/thioredoxin
MDPYGMIAVGANQDALAEQQIAARLATPGLSFMDRAFTLRMAVQAFADSDIPSRLPIAEKYLAQLDALADAAGYWQFIARHPMLYAYYRLGRSKEVARIGTRMLERVGAIPYPLRGVMYGPGMPFSYGVIIDALSGQLNGRATIRTLNEKLLAWAVPPVTLVAHDSSFRWEGEYRKKSMQGMIDVSERVGEPGTPIVAQYWANRGSTRDSQTVQVNDGRVRVIEVGSWSCGPCMAALPGLSRLSKRLPEAEFIFLTTTMGGWGNREIEPKAEADSLAEHFLKKLHAEIPIGIAFNEKGINEDSLIVHKILSHTWDAGQYPQMGKPCFYILDGKGTIRRILAGYDRDLEENVASIVEFLQKEQRS